MRLVCVVAAMSWACGGFSEPPGIISGDAGAGTCTDGVLGGDETDIDCGGACGPCSVGESCIAGLDCETQACAVGVCLVPTSCKILGEGGVTDSGIYTLFDSADAIDVFCDMETDGGGWTLIVKASSEGTALASESLLWTNSDVLAADDLSPNTTAVGIDAKFAAFSVVRGTELRLQVNDPALSILHPPFAAATALELFSGPEIATIENDDGCLDEALVASASFDPLTMRHGQGHQFFGINGSDVDGGDEDAIRFGFASNDEGGNTWRPRQGIGGDNESLVWVGQTDCSGCGGCYGTAYDPGETSANLWIR